MAKKKENNNNNNGSIEKYLWKTADKLRKNIDAAEYKHVVLGLIFLKYIPDAFEELYEKLKSGEGEYAGADPEDKDEYKAENVFFVPETARWTYMQSKAKLPTDIRKALIEAGLVDCIVNLPAKLFLNTQIPACLWFLNRNKTSLKANGNTPQRSRTDEILFIDARNEGHLINRRYDRPYEDIKGFCESVSIERVRELDYVLTPGRYVGLPDEEDDFDFKERFTALKFEFEAQLKEEAELNKVILKNLKKVQLV